MEPNSPDEPPRGRWTIKWTFDWTVALMAAAMALAVFGSRMAGH